MDSYEATKVVYSRIQALDPENASKVMGFIFIQDPGDKEMIRLAFGPETLLVSLINQAKAHLGISSNASSSSSSSTPHSHSQSLSSPRLIIIPNENNNNNNNNNGYLSPNASSPSSPWSSSFSPRPTSYAAVVGSGGSSSSSLLVPFSDSMDFGPPVMDPIMSPSGRSDSMVFPFHSSSNGMESGGGGLHRRSFSVNDAASFIGGGGEEGSFGWRGPCMYFARGFCKNGGSCKYLHGGGGFDLGPDSPMMVGSPGSNCSSKLQQFDGFDELLRMKAIQHQHQRLAAASQLMGGAGAEGGGGGPSFPFNNKAMPFINDSPRSAAAALMMGEEFHKLGRCRPDRSEFSAMGLGAVDSSSRQIYLTFPADSTFKEEDVSNYFSKFGPVQDVRIPYQQKRMFGFVTFVYPETVKMILAKGNPHFVCDSRVLVKPYKEKGKIPEKRQHQHQFDRGDFAACLSPTGLDCRESYDFPIGPRMLLNNQEILRRKLEQAELQQALELQGRRLLNLQLIDMKNHHHHHHRAYQFQQPHGIPISPRVQPQLQANHNFLLQSENLNYEVLEETNDISAADDSLTDAVDEAKEACDKSNDNASGNGEQQFVDPDNDNLHESLEHILPDNLFTSPTKSAAGGTASIFSSALAAEGEDTSSAPSSTISSSVMPAPASLNMAALNSCYFQMPRFSSGQEAVEM